MVTWYEKTVEYAFARKFLEVAAMPLAGSAEKIGDTMFYHGNSFFIIEFKKGIKTFKNGKLYSLNDQIKQEQDKYTDVNNTIKSMPNYPAHSSHYIVFGVYNQIEMEDDKKFQLAITPYCCFLNNFVPEKYDELKFLLDLHQYTKIDNLNELETYLQFLIDSKITTNNDSSSVDYGNTLIVDKDGNACALSDKAGLAKLNLNFEIPTPKNTPSSPSFGMK